MTERPAFLTAAPKTTQMAFGLGGGHKTFQQGAF